ncbi:MAG TPA: hypothetical protein VNL71_01380 [Chloroflexota bacterium]|nr:hypothetical protein [Chloroflexota bacterium]
MSRLHGRVVRLEQAINHDGSLSETEANGRLLDVADHDNLPEEGVA